MLSEYQDFFYHIFAYYDSPLPISGSDEIIKRLQMSLNNPQCGHKEGQKFPFFGEITIKASPPIYIVRTTMSCLLKDLPSGARAGYNRRKKPIGLGLVNLGGLISCQNGGIAQHS